MKLPKIITKVFVLTAVLAVFSPISAQALAVAQETKIEGLIVSRNGDNVVMRSETGTVTVVTVTKSTKIDELKGLLGIRSNDVGSAMLVPGLKISVEGELSGQQTIAKSIQFHINDLETANAIQAALVVPQQQIKELMEKVAAQTQELAAQKQKNADQDMLIAAGQAEDAATAKRIGDLADYDIKAETNILFDVNSATLSSANKAELKTIADKAKALRGYLIQVAGYTSSTGSASHNQDLSDRRAAAVVRFLQQEGDVGISRVLTPVAMGMSKPVASNETEQGRAENRRVTVKIAVNRGIAQ